MRRDSRKINRKHTNDKTITYGMLIAAVVVIAVISVMTYKNINNNDSNKYASLDNKKINSMINQVEDSQSTSTEMGKTVNEILEQNTTSTNNTIDTNEITNTLNTVNKNLATNTTKNTTSTNTNAVNTNTVSERQLQQHLKRQRR